MKLNYPVSLALCIMAAVLLTACGSKQEAAPAAPPEVLVTDVSAADVPISSEAIATLNGSTNAEIHSQVNGYLIKQVYSEGSLIKAGDLMFEIDPKPFQADLDKALASLANMQAQQKRTQQNLDRYAILVKSGAVSQQEYQTELQNNLSAQADVNAAQAGVMTAQINLGYTKITSPIEGIAGHANVNIGDLITPTTTMTTVSTLDPIRADFTIPEQFYLDHAQQFENVTKIPLQDRPEHVQLILADGTVYPLKGRFWYLNRQVQTSTGAIAAFALFPNPNRILRPGQYAKVSAVTQQIDNAVLVPQRSVTQLQTLNQVWVVKPDNTAEVRNVTLGDVAGSDWIITSGIKAGEKVVVEGIQKCREGMTVNPQPYVAPAGENQPSTNIPAVTPPETNSPSAAPPAANAPPAIPPDTNVPAAAPPATTNT